jgi:hypothetical protein
VRNIFLFGSPNGLCSSITESKHIDAVKKPWRRSRRYKALLFILRTNTRMSKIAAARTEFARRGMLSVSLIEHARREATHRAVRLQMALDGHEDIEWEDWDGDGAPAAGDVGEDALLRAAKGDVGAADGPRVNSTAVHQNIGKRPDTHLTQPDTGVSGGSGRVKRQVRIRLCQALLAGIRDVSGVSGCQTLRVRNSI